MISGSTRGQASRVEIVRSAPQIGIKFGLDFRA